jgi:tetratricopeptide (TPR) repeat protein
VGDAPNIASKLQDLAVPGTVLLSEATAKLVEQRYRLKREGLYELKGAARSIVAYSVVEERSSLDEELLTSLTPQVNRDAEKNLLVSAWGLARDGIGQVLHISGEAGIGKSRLVQWLRDAVAERGRARLIVFRCSQWHRDNALFPFTERLRLACDFAHQDGAAERIQKLRNMLRGWSPELEQDLAVFCALLSLPRPHDVEDVNPQALKQRTQKALEEWFLTYVFEKPALVVFEDLHWIDPSTLEILQKLVPQIKTRQAMLILTSRTDFQWPDGADGPIHVIPLDRLEPSHIAEIISNVCGEAEFPRSVVNSLVDRADGVPIFAEQLTRAIMDAGAAGVKEGPGDSGQSRPFSVPSTMRDTLVSRLDRLGATRWVAQVASILGREFDREALLDVSSLDAALVDQALKRMIDGQIILQTRAHPNSMYMFSHALLQEAAYQSMLKGMRYELHSRVGRLLQQRRKQGIKGGLVDERALVRNLAHHWRQAAELSDGGLDATAIAVQYLTEAGEFELGLSGYTESKAYLDTALKLVAILPTSREVDELELRLRLRLGTVYRATAGWASDLVRDEFGRCRDLCLKLGDRPEFGQVVYAFCGYHLFRANYPRALELARECCGEAERTDDHDLLLHARAKLSNSQFWLCQFTTSRENADHVLRNYDPARHAAHAVAFGMDPGVYALMFAVWVPWLQGEPRKALLAHEALLRVTAGLKHPFSQALALNTSSCFYINSGDISGALRAGDSLVKLALENQLPVYQMFGVLFRGWAVAEKGRPKEVIDEVTETYHNYTKYVGGLGQTYAALIAANVFRRAGRLAEGIEILTNAIATAERNDCQELAYHAELVRMQGEMMAVYAPHDIADATSLLQRAFELAQKRLQPPFALRSAMSLLHLAKRENQPLQPSIAMVRAALEQFREGDAFPEWQAAWAAVSAVEGVGAALTG